MIMIMAVIIIIIIIIIIMKNEGFQFLFFKGAEVHLISEAGGMASSPSP
jgi:hypothetical protein